MLVFILEGSLSFLRTLYAQDERKALKIKYKEKMSINERARKELSDIVYILNKTPFILRWLAVKMVFVMVLGRVIGSLSDSETLRWTALVILYLLSIRLFFGYIKEPNHGQVLQSLLPSWGIAVVTSEGDIEPYKQRAVFSRLYFKLPWEVASGLPIPLAKSSPLSVKTEALSSDGKIMTVQVVGSMTPIPDGRLLPWFYLVTNEAALRILLSQIEAEVQKLIVSNLSSQLYADNKGIILNGLAKLFAGQGLSLTERKTGRMVSRLEVPKVDFDDRAEGIKQALAIAKDAAEITRVLLKATDGDPILTGTLLPYILGGKRIPGNILNIIGRPRTK